MRAINHGLSGPGAGWLMVKITSPETWTFPLIAFAAGLAVIGRKRGIIAVILAVAVVALADGITHYGIKPLFGRIRPCNVLDGINVLVGCTQSFSFPSNHAVNSMAVAGVIGGIFRPLLLVLVPVGLLVCLSRIAVGVHYPLDVIVGALLGFGLGWGAAILVKKWTAKPSKESDEG